MSTIEEPGPYDALEKAEIGEPLFPLLGRDPCAPATVTEWARLRRNRAIKLWGESQRETDQEALKAELAQCANAEQVALDMADWRKGNETVEAIKSGYNEIVKSEVEIAEAEHLTRLAVNVRHLREAAYHLCEARDGLIDIGLIGAVTAGDLVEMLARINGLAEEHTPKRQQFAAEPELPIGAGELT